MTFAIPTDPRVERCLRLRAVSAAFLLALWSSTPANCLAHLAHEADRIHPFDEESTVSQFTHPLASIPICEDFNSHTIPDVWKDILEAAAAADTDISIAKEAISTGLSKYPLWIQKHIEKIHILGSMRVYGKSIGGTYHGNTIYISAWPGRGRDRIEQTFHHEFSSVLLHHHNSCFPTNDWLALLPEGISYSDDPYALLGPHPSRTPMTLYNDGFVTNYSSTSLENDFNTIASHLFVGDETLWRRADAFHRIGSKLSLAIKFYCSLDPLLNEEYFRRLSIVCHQDDSTAQQSQANIVTFAGIPICTVVPPDLIPPSWRSPQINATITPIDGESDSVAIQRILDALRRYPTPILAAHVDRVYVVANCVISGSQMPFVIIGNTLVVSIAGGVGSPEYIIHRRVHYAISTLIFKTYKEEFDESQWRALNSNEYEYSDQNIMVHESNTVISLTSARAGFINTAARATIADDVASVTTELFLNRDRFWRVANACPRIAKKVSLISGFYKRLDSEMGLLYFLSLPEVDQY